MAPTPRLDPARLITLQISTGSDGLPSIPRILLVLCRLAQATVRRAPLFLLFLPCRRLRTHSDSGKRQTLQHVNVTFDCVIHDHGAWSAVGSSLPDANVIVLESVCQRPRSHCPWRTETPWCEEPCSRGFGHCNIARRRRRPEARRATHC